MLFFSLIPEFRSFSIKEGTTPDTSTAKEHSSAHHILCYNQFFLILLLPRLSLFSS